jgi:hypothetical protein
MEAQHLGCYTAVLKKEKKKRETYEALTIEKNRIHDGSKSVEEKREIAHTSKATFKREKVMINGLPKILGLESIPHTCTSGSKCMTCISSDLIFDLTIYVVQVCLSFIPT